MSLGGPELVIILGIVVLLGGASRIPKLAKSIGEASREFKRGTTEAAADAAPETAEASAEKQPATAD